MQVEQVQNQNPRELINPTSVGYTPASYSPTFFEGARTPFGYWFEENMLWPKPSELNGDQIETLDALLLVCKKLDDKRREFVPESHVKPPAGRQYLPWPLVGFMPYGRDRQTNAENWVLVVIMARGEKNGWNPSNCYDNYRAKNLAFMIALDGSAIRIPSDNLSWCRAGSSTLNLTRMMHVQLDFDDGERELRFFGTAKALANRGWNNEGKLKVSHVTEAMHPYSDVRRMLELLPTDFCSANLAVVSASAAPKQPVEGGEATTTPTPKKSKSSKDKSKKKRDASPKRASKSTPGKSTTPSPNNNTALVDKARAELEAQIAAQIALGEKLNRKLLEQQAKNKQLSKSKKDKTKSKKDKKKSSKKHHKKSSKKHHKKHHRKSSSSSSSSSSEEESDNLEEASGSELEFYESLFGVDESFSSSEEENSDDSSSSSE